jgi:hypothetical protein
MITRQDLADAPLPQHGESYSIVKHDMVLDLIEKALASTEYKIVKEHLYLSGNKQVSEISLTLDYQVSDDVECVIRFLNSYNKQIAFRINTALRVKESGNLFMLSGTNFKRVHKGAALSAIEDSFYMQLIDLKDNFDLLNRQKEALKHKLMSKNQAFLLSAILYLEKSIITSEQLSYIKKEFNKSTYDYGCDKLSAFHYLMIATLAVAQRGTRIDEKYSQHSKLHEFFISTFKLENIAKRLNIENAFPE